ncbi:histidine phosphatase family protein [Paenibacillus sp. UNC496MF]|uniref:histidine phosphatase family protein n=1 Tax=Paenibacillus sp. UNC496MF TaxID=1502753 RepID=UPI0035270A2A
MELYHFRQAELFERLKSASAADPILCNEYAEQQFMNMALAYRYKAMAAKQYRNPFAAAHRSLLDDLRRGGYILYTRHGEATVGEDQPNLNFQDCMTLRNLSDEGRRQAIAYGETIRRLRIPVSLPVEASPFCRTIETATLAFGGENVQVDATGYDIYRLSGSLSPGEQSTILNKLGTVLGKQPPPGRNQIIIAHSFPAGVGLGQIPNLGTVVVKPNGFGNGYDLVDKLSLEELGGLADENRSL